MRIGAGSLDLFNLERLRTAGAAQAVQGGDPLLNRPIADPLGTAEKLLGQLHDKPDQLAAMVKRLEDGAQAQGGLPEGLKGLLEILKLILELVLAGRGGELMNGGLRRMLGGGGGGGGGGYRFERMRPWSEDDKKFLDTALRSNSANYGNQINAWRQSSEGNCSSVACIKAAIDRYDNKVFDAVAQNGDGYQVRMQDGQTVNVSGQEMSMARAASRFRSNNPEALAYANLCYAAMAKRALGEGHEGARSYGQALAALNNGENPWDTVRFLGLKDKTIQVDPRTLNGQDSVVAWSGRHAIFVDANRAGGHTADHYGSGRHFNGTDTNGWRLSGAFTLRGREQPAMARRQPAANRNVQPAAPRQPAAPKPSAARRRTAANTGPRRS